MTTVTHTPAPSPAPGEGTGRTRSLARIAAAVLGGLCLLASVALLAGGGVLLAADQSLRLDGYLTSDPIALAANGYAVTTDEVDLTDADPLPGSDRLLGITRLRVTNGDLARPVFVGIGRADEVTGYLAGVQHSVLTEIADPATTYDERAGTAPASRPGDADVWVAKVEGTGTQTLTWPQDEGRWRVVVMNADGSAGIDLVVDVGAKVPAIRSIGRWSMVASLPVSIVGVVLLVVGVRRPAVHGGDPS
jgi:hypothetical protein